jgi:membrane protein DedA with SNARE-associated domain
VIVKSSANETLSRWVYQGVPLLIAVGIVAAFVLRVSFGLPLARLALPIAVLVGIQVLFFVGMYGARKRYRRTGDLRTAALVTGTFEDNYVGFSVFMGVVTCIVFVVFSFVKPKPNS